MKALFHFLREESQKTQYKKISMQEAKSRLDSEPDIRLVDVRTPEEYKQEHIENSLLIPDYDIPSEASRLLPDKNTKIFVYCRSGARACGAARTLIQLGYTDVTDIGGIMSWPYETVS